ncbi:ATP-binding protein [Deinococcus apachensis]|uniref:ATP-binding protein n=1 Tax=Deinococcus apachensis TaxID=309886 RepID=UPI00035DEC8C|nr:BTAD domain-containing putative transcriptional regulator [Deinococcus apachensis]
MTSPRSWRLEVLGTPRLTRPDGSSLHPEGGALALLTYLALEGPTTRSRLAGLLWPDTVESAARNNLVHLLRRLQRVYGGGLLRADDAVDLAPGVEVDVRAFLEAARVGEAEEGDITPLLEGVEFDDRPDLADWLLAWRERLGHLRAEVLTRRAGRQEEGGDLPAAISTTLRLLDLNPVAEEAWRRLMRLHYLAGDRGAALAAFERCRAVLRREFGAEPSPETGDLAREVERGGAPTTTPAPRRRMPLSVLRPPNLVGRGAEWARMEAAWEAGQFLILAGEAGIGKSRLARDFAASKGEVLHLEGRPGDALVPYSTTARNLRRIFARTPDLPLEPWMRVSLSRLLPELLDGTAEPGTPEPDMRLHAAIRHVFEVGLAGVSAFVYDDLHLADRASIEAGFVLISSSFPLGQPGGVPRLICTVRPGEVPAFMEDVFRRGGAAGHSVRIDLERLGEAEVGALVRDLGVPAVRDLGPQLARFTGGNPFFVLETVKHMLEAPSQDGALPVAARVSQLIADRLARLSPAALGAARAAAVLQSDVRIELVAAVLGAPLLEVAAAWEELEAAQIMTGERFSHDLVQETVLAGMPAAVRRLLNRSAARVLPGEGASPARVAHHWREGGDPRAAAPLLERAASEALGRLRPLEAVELFRQAAELYGASGETAAEFEALAQAAESPWRAEQVDLLEPVMARLAVLAQTGGERARLHAWRAARLMGQGQPAAAEQAAREGLALPGVHPPGVRAALLRELLQAQAQLGREEARATLREVLTQGETLHDERERMLGEAAVGGALLRLGQLEQAEPHLRRAAAAFKRQGDAYRTAWALHGLALSLQYGRGGVVAAIQVREDLAVRLERAHAPTLERANLTEISGAFLALRDYRSALAWLDRVRVHDEQLGDDRSPRHRLRADLLWTLGAYDECEAAARRGLAFPDPSDLGAFFPWLHVGRVRAVRGDVAAAREAFHHLDQGLDRQDYPYVRGQGLLGRAGLGGPDLAVQLTTDALDLARTHGEGQLETQALAARAGALLALGRAGEARVDSELSVSRLPDWAPAEDYALPLLVHHRVLTALGDERADTPRQQALAWLAGAVRLVPEEYQDAFLNRHVTHRALRTGG